MAEYENGDVLRYLPCLHYYHKDCIEDWLKAGLAVRFRCSRCAAWGGGRELALTGPPPSRAAQRSLTCPMCMKPVEIDPSSVERLPGHAAPPRRDGDDALLAP